MTYLEQLLGGAAVEWKPLREVCQKTEKINWKYISEEREFQYIDLSSVSLLYNKIEQTQSITVATAPSRAQQIVKVDDVLFGTTRPTLKRFCVVPECYDGQICSTGFCILRANKARILPRFLFYNLQLPSFQEYVALNQQGAIYPVISNKKVMEFLIPLPPLAVQERIVEILDKFTALIEALETELELRTQQYAYYRNKLLRFGKEVEWKPLGEVCAFRNGFAFLRGKYQSSGLPIIRITDIQHTRVSIGEAFFNSEDYTNDLSVYEVKKGDILIALSGATTGKIGAVEFEEKAYINQRVGKFLPKEDVLNTRYLYHYLLSKTHIIHQMAFGGAQENLSSVRLLKEFLIPLPPLAVQEQIVAILDKFHTLVHSISEGLPAEIAMRRRQYEYYRNLLLRFPPPQP